MANDLNALAQRFAAGLLTMDGVYRTALPPGRYAGHSRSNPTTRSGLVFALKGEAVFTFNGRPYRLGPGKVLHGGKNMELILETGPSGFEYILIHYTAEPMIAFAGSPHFMLDCGESLAVAEKLEQLRAVMAAPGGISALRGKELFYGILHETLTCARSKLNRDSRPAIEQAIEYIHAHYMEPLTLPKLAARHGMEVKPFAYLFSKYAGMSPISYLIRHRMKRAEHLLLTTAYPVGEIARSVGYSDVHYFSRLFRKHRGCAPTEFRRQSEIVHLRLDKSLF